MIIPVRCFSCGKVRPRVSTAIAHCRLCRAARGFREEWGWSFEERKGPRARGDWGVFGPICATRRCRSLRVACFWRVLPREGCCGKCVGRSCRRWIPLVLVLTPFQPCCAARRRFRARFARAQVIGNKYETYLKLLNVDYNEVRTVSFPPSPPFSALICAAVFARLTALLAPSPRRAGRGARLARPEALLLQAHAADARGPDREAAQLQLVRARQPDPQLRVAGSGVIVHSPLPLLSRYPL